MKNCRSSFLTTSIAVVAAIFTVTLDRWAAVSLDGRFWAVAVGTSILFGALSMLCFREVRSVIPFVAFLLFLVVLPFVEFSPVKPYRKFFSGITPGLTEKEVIERLSYYFPDSGKYPRPKWTQREDGSLQFWLDPNDGRYDAETITVTFWQARTLAKVYMGD